MLSLSPRRRLSASAVYSREPLPYSRIPGPKITYLPAALRGGLLVFALGLASETAGRGGSAC
ncbi:MAG TPA: hypothetical protein VN203_28580, partial [Candidatus Acidoferrum sp.]|nr:hypothetical protein [Candidatus Acidoferrum sp.]